jgi:hypothetical protein
MKRGPSAVPFNLERRKPVKFETAVDRPFARPEPQITLSSSSILGGRHRQLRLVWYIDSMGKSGIAHETQRTATRNLVWNGGGDACRHDIADALSCYFFHERRR